MTKEEQWIKESIENYIFAYTGKRAKISDADAQHFTASVMSYLNLCTPSLPSNLDEAAEEVMPISYGSLEVDCYGGSEPVYSREQMVEIFKAGAEWMAEQVMMLKWKHPEEKYQYPECLTRIMDEYGDWHYTISEGHLNPDCEYISLAELSLRLATRL